MKPKPKKNDRSGKVNKTIKPIKAWACVHPNGVLNIMTHTPKDRIWEVMEINCLKTRNILFEEGYRIVRVRVEVV